MYLGSCCGSRLASLTHAAAKFAASRLRSLGLLPVRNDWAARAAVCERCPLRVIRGRVSYCGRPFLDEVIRDPATQGCGCPTHAKAKDPAEHCPLDPHNRPASRTDGDCSCKWCEVPVTAPSTTSVQRGPQA
jgi:hypothetical protein